MQQYISYYTSAVGKILLAANGTQLTGLWWVGQKYFAQNLLAEHTEVSLPIFEEVKAWLDCYFSGHNPDFMPALQLSGTPFRLAVWNILQQIPYGQTVSYKEIATELALRQQLQCMSAQAVGGAVGHNPISIMVPCHRVVGSNGSMTGYAGGLNIKKELLRLENANMGLNVCNFYQ